jgi:hypothetical protein
MWREWEGKEGGGGGVQDKRLGEPWQGHMPSVRPAVRTGIGQLSWGGGGRMFACTLSIWEMCGHQPKTDRQPN